MNPTLQLKTGTACQTEQRNAVTSPLSVRLTRSTLAPPAYLSVGNYRSEFAGPVT